jgi:hypothetical protein
LVAAHGNRSPADVAPQNETRAWPELHFKELA